MSITPHVDVIPDVRNTTITLEQEMPAENTAAVYSPLHTAVNIPNAWN
jgi:hypothetical protein